MTSRYSRIWLIVAALMFATTPAAGQTVTVQFGLVVENQNNPGYEDYGGTPLGQLFIFETKWTPIYPITLTSYTFLAVVYCKVWDGNARPAGWSLSSMIRTGKATKKNGHYLLEYVFGANPGGVMDIEIGGGVFSQTGAKASGGDMGIPFSGASPPVDPDQWVIDKMPPCP